MERREFVAGAGMLLAAGHAPRLHSVDDAAAVKQAVADVYAAFSGFDEQKYRALLTDDYQLLENGELLDLEGDVAMRATPDSGHQRTDACDFRSVKIHDDIAYAVYFLKSEIRDRNGTRNREWLESTILRRPGTGWRWRCCTRPESPSPGPDTPEESNGQSIRGRRHVAGRFHCRAERPPRESTRRRWHAHPSVGLSAGILS